MTEPAYTQLTLFPAGSLDDPANHFPWLESKKAKGTTVTCGRKCSELSPSLRRIGLSVRTYLESCELPRTTFARIWSVRATTLGYLILKLRLSERRTEENESPLLPTPTQSWGSHGVGFTPNTLGRYSEATKTLWFGTPTATYKPRTSRFAARRTPNPAEPACGPLNPTWVEWLMGFPTGWTDLSASGTP